MAHAAHKSRKAAATPRRASSPCWRTQHSGNCATSGRAASPGAIVAEYARPGVCAAERISARLARAGPDRAVAGGGESFVNCQFSDADRRRTGAGNPIGDPRANFTCFAADGGVRRASPGSISGRPRDAGERNARRHGSARRDAGTARCLESPGACRDRESSVATTSSRRCRVRRVAQRDCVDFCSRH